MGDLVEVAFVGDEFQAEMIRALLEEHGIPSIQEERAGCWCMPSERIGLGR